MSSVVSNSGCPYIGGRHPGRAVWLLAFLWPAPGMAGQLLDRLRLEPVVLLSSSIERAAPCGWSIVSDRAHPERPRHIVPAVSTAATDGCVVAGGSAEGGLASVRAAATLSMVWASAATRLVLRVTALEDGRTGAVIRCRSSFAGSILLGRVVDARTVEWVGEAGKDRW